MRSSKEVRHPSVLHLSRIADTCNSMLPKTVQILLFSATFPEHVNKYAEKFAPDANAMKLRQQELTVKGIAQMYMDCPKSEDKYDILVKLYGLMTVGSSVIFVKVRCQWVSLSSSSLF